MNKCSILASLTGVSEAGSITDIQVGPDGEVVVIGRTSSGSKVAFVVASEISVLPCGDFGCLQDIRAGIALFTKDDGERQHVQLIQLASSQIVDQFEIVGRAQRLTNTGVGLFILSPTDCGSEWRIMRRASAARREPWGSIVGTGDYELCRSKVDGRNVAFHAIHRAIIGRNVGMIGFLNLDEARPCGILPLESLSKEYGFAYDLRGFAADTAYGAIYSPNGPRPLVLKADDYVSRLEVPEPSAIRVDAMHPHGSFPGLVSVGGKDCYELFWHLGLPRLKSVVSLITNWPASKFGAQGTMFLSPAKICTDGSAFMIASSQGEDFLVKVSRS